MRFAPNTDGREQDRPTEMGVAITVHRQVRPTQQRWEAARSGRSSLQISNHVKPNVTFAMETYETINTLRFPTRFSSLKNTASEEHEDCAKVSS